MNSAYPADGARICPTCGVVYWGDKCPTNKRHKVPPLEEARAFSVVEPEQEQGSWTTYTLDGEEYPALHISRSRVVVFGPGENGHVGVYTVGEPDGS